MAAAGVEVVSDVTSDMAMTVLGLLCFYSSDTNSKINHTQEHNNIYVVRQLPTSTESYHYRIFPGGRLHSHLTFTLYRTLKLSQSLTDVLLLFLDISTPPPHLNLYTIEGGGDWLSPNPFHSLVGWPLG